MSGPGGHAWQQLPRAACGSDRGQDPSATAFLRQGLWGCWWNWYTRQAVNLLPGIRFEGSNPSHPTLPCRLVGWPSGRWRPVATRKQGRYRLAGGSNPSPTARNSSHPAIGGLMLYKYSPRMAYVNDLFLRRGK